MQVPQEKRKAWTKKSTKMKFVGYQEGTRNYQFVDKKGGIVRSPNAAFIQGKEILPRKENKKVESKPKLEEFESQDENLPYLIGSESDLSSEEEEK